MRDSLAEDRLPIATPVPAAERPAKRTRVFIAGILVDDVTDEEALTHIERMIHKGGSHYMVVANAAKVVAAHTDHRLKEILTEADLLTADGMSVVWASRALRHPLRCRVTGIDLFEKLVGVAWEKSWPIYLLGGTQPSIEGTVEQLKKRHPRILIAGYRNGYFEASDSGEIADAIRKSGAYLLFVGMGSPRQEKWISENLRRAGVRFALGVGGTFDHVSGLSKRAPRWMQQIGLEWLYRLAREPRRLWRRYLIGNALFGYLIAKQLFSRNDRTGAPFR